MALITRSDVAVAMVAMAAAAVMLLTVSGADQPIYPCPPPGRFVYPYPSSCWNPALYVETYELEAAGPLRIHEGRLAPEWHESSSSYRVRLAQVGARYRFTYITRERRTAVAQNDKLQIVNVDTGRALGWREAGNGEWLLVEGSSAAAEFQFTKASGVALPCTLLPSDICEAYHILSAGTPSHGVSPLQQGGVTYFKLGSSPLPFLLLRSGASADSGLATLT